MFGYVKPYKLELTIKDYEIFKAYYCGLCKTIKENFGNLPRMCLNYDMTFMAILLDSLSDEEGVFYINRCFMHPLQKRMMLRKNDPLNFSAYLNVALTYYKICDDVQDEKNFKDTLLKTLFKRYKILFDNQYSDLNLIIKNNLNLLNKYETSKVISSIDEVCHPFSQLTGELLLNYQPTLPCNKESLFKLGYNLGKWIYLMDAFDDLQDDMKKNKFNPINVVFNKSNLSFNDFYISIKDRIDFSITCSANSIFDNYNNLQILKNNELLKNILTLGIMDRYQLVQDKYNNIIEIHDEVINNEKSI